MADEAKTESIKQRLSAVENDEDAADKIGIIHTEVCRDYPGELPGEIEDLFSEAYGKWNAKLKEKKDAIIKEWSGMSDAEKYRYAAQHSREFSHPLFNEMYAQLNNERLKVQPIGRDLSLERLLHLEDKDVGIEEIYFAENEFEKYPDVAKHLVDFKSKTLQTLAIQAVCDDIDLIDANSLEKALSVGIFTDRQIEIVFRAAAQKKDEIKVSSILQTLGTRREHFINKLLSQLGESIENDRCKKSVLEIVTDEHLLPVEKIKDLYLQNFDVDYNPTVLDIVAAFPLLLDKDFPIESLSVHRINTLSSFIVSYDSFSAEYKKRFAINAIKKDIKQQGQRIKDALLVMPAKELREAIKREKIDRGYLFELVEIEDNVNNVSYNNNRWGRLPGIYEFQNLLKAKGDVVVASLFFNYSIEDILETYLRIRQGKTLVDCYHECWKQNPQAIVNLSNVLLSNYYQNERSLTFVESIIKRSIHFSDFTAKMLRYVELCELKHNNERYPEDQWESIFWNPSIDITADWLENFLESYSEFARQRGVEALYEKLDSVDPRVINAEEFKRSFNRFLAIEEAIKNGSYRISPEDIKYLTYCSTMMNRLSNIEAVKEYMDEAKEKIPELFLLDTSFGPFKFEVLKYLDPYAFDVGLDTDCCQRLGGAGEDAAVDSFINPTAGVLILKYMDSLLAQSYFHYADGGYILDNVEFNEKNCKRMGWRIQNDECLELSKLYADLAAETLKRQPTLKFFRCGLEYNKLMPKFSLSSMEEDPRRFDTNQYSDFSIDRHLDLLQPNEDLMEMKVNFPKG